MDYKVYVGNINYEATVKEVVDFFSQYGHVLEAMLIPSKSDPGKIKGFGFITFETEEGMKKAINDSGIEFLGRKIVIKSTAENNELENVIYKAE